MLTLSDLFARGAIFALHCGHWRARERLMPSDVGMADTPEIRRALYLGSAKLVPAEALAPVLAIQRRAALEIDLNSLAFRMIPGARYVPEDRTEGLSLVLDQLRAEHSREADAFCERYASVVRDQLAEVYRALVEALSRSHPDAKTLAERAIDRITRELPPADEVRALFYLRWNVYVIDSVDNALADELAGTQGEVSDVLSGMISGLRADVESAVRNVVDVLSRGGKWTERSANAAEDVFDRAEAMNILGDRKLRDLVAQARFLVRSVDPKSEGQAGIVNALGSVAQALTADAAEAVAAAERSLTSYSQRKIAIARPRGEEPTNAVR